MMEESKDAVSCLIIYPSGNVIIQEHTKTGMLTIPSGTIEYDELPGDAIVRELKEELGIEVDARTDFAMVELFTHPKLLGQDGHREFRYILQVNDDFVYHNAEPEKHPWMGPMHPLSIQSTSLPLTQILTSVICKMEKGEYNKYMTV